MVCHCEVFTWSHRETMPREVSCTNVYQFRFFSFNNFQYEYMAMERLQNINLTRRHCTLGNFFSFVFVVYWFLTLSSFILTGWIFQLWFSCWITDLLIEIHVCRWHNHLNPDIKKDAWTLEEELALMNAHRRNGNKWAEIAKVLPGRYHIFFIYEIFICRKLWCNTAMNL